MQNVSDTFNTLSRADIRPLNWRAAISFTKEYNADVDFFTIGVSAIGSGDFIPGTGDAVLEWDKYSYQDFSDRIISVEVTNQVEPFGSMSMPMADIILDNYDGYFTPNSNSPISDYILPYRPIRLYMGFGDELVPKFIGLTEKMPIIDEKARTATFHCIGFMYSLLNRPLDQAVILENKRTDEIIQTLFEFVGLAADQMDLDPGFTIVPFTYVAKDTKLKDILAKIVEAEHGRLYMSENGYITFRNRQSYDTDSVWSFDAYRSVDDISTRTQDDIYNVVEIKGKVRAVQPKQRYWKLPSSVLLRANTTTEIWAEFQDPVTSVDEPEYYDDANTSLFRVNTDQFGDGSDDPINVTLISTERFAMSYKMIFQNSGSNPLFLTDLQLYATPAIVVNNIYIREQDDVSVGKYDERLLPIENDFFQDETEAESQAIVILNDFAEFGGINRLEVQGNMALQVDDTVRVDIFGRIGEYKITKIVDKIALPGRYTQIIDVKEFERRSYFTIGVSLIGGSDAIRP